MASTENLLKQAVAMRKQMENSPNGPMIFQEPPKRRIVNDIPSVKPSRVKVKKEFKVGDADPMEQSGRNEQTWFDPNRGDIPNEARPQHVTDAQYDRMFYHEKGEEPPSDVHHLSGEDLARKFSQTALGRSSPVAHNVQLAPQKAADVRSQSGTELPNDQSVFVTNQQPNLDDFVPLDELPSRGRFYKTPMLAQPLRLIDMLMVENMDNDNKMETVTEILGRRTRCDGGPLQILTGDEIYILQYLRASSFPKDPYSWTKFKCEHCGTLVDDPGYKIDFSNMLFSPNANPDDLWELYKEYGFHPVENVGGVAAIEVYVRRRLHDYLYKEQMDEWKRQGFVPSKPYVALLNMALVVDIPGCRTMQSKIEFLGNLNKDDAAKFLGELSKCSFRTKTKVAHTCPNCGGVTVTPFPFRYSAFVSSIQIGQSEKT